MMNGGSGNMQNIAQTASMHNVQAAQRTRGGHNHNVYSSQSHGTLPGGFTAEQNYPLPATGSTTAQRSGVFPVMNKAGQVIAGMPQTAAMPMQPGFQGDASHNANHILLPPDHFISPAVSWNGPLPKNGFHQSGPMPLMNLDISSSHFMSAMKFDGLSNGSNHATGSSENVQPRLYPEEFGDGDIGGHEQESQYSLSDPDEQSQVVSEAHADLLEQQQAKTQAQLLDRFKQLREWQVAQQEVLMRQQQDQLTMLKQEQSRVQRMIVKQREAQWGGDQQAQPQVVRKTASPPRSPHRKPPKHPNSTLPQAIAQGTLAMARKNRYPDLDPALVDAEAMPRPSTPVQVVKGRPLPGIVSGPNTPLEYLEHGNPNLDSDTNTLASGTPLEEGIARLAETASETSEGPSYFQSKSDAYDLDMEEPTEVEIKSVKRLGPPIPLAINDSSHAIKHQRSKMTLSPPQGIFKGQFTLPHHMMPKQIPRGLYSDGLQHLPQQNHSSQIPNGTNPTMLVTSRENTHSHGAPPLGQNQQHDILDFREFEHGGSDTDDYEGYGESEALPEDECEDQSMGDEEPDCAAHTDDVPATSVKLDEKPVGGTKKTFEELLEEELRKEDEKMKGQASESTASGKKTFLKRGEGVARFSSIVKKPARKETKSRHPSRTPAPQKVSPVTAKSKPAQKPSSSSKTSAPPKGATNKTVKRKSPPNKLTLKLPPARKSSSADKAHSVPATSRVAEHSVSATPREADTKAPRDSTGEISFQQCMHDREQIEEVETEELEEFMILEQYADDNASFLSNISAVNRALDSDKQKEKPASHFRNTGPGIAVKVSPTIDEGTSSDQGSSEESDNYDSQNDTLQEEDVCSNQTSNGTKDAVVRENVQSVNDQNDSRKAILRTIHRKVSALGKRSPPKSESSEQLQQGQDTGTVKVQEQCHDHNMNIHTSDYNEGNPGQSSSSSEGEEFESDSVEEINVKDVLMNSNLSNQMKSGHIVARNRSEGITATSETLGDKYTASQSVESVSGPSAGTSSHSPARSQDPAPSTSGLGTLEFGDGEEWGEDDASTPRISPHKPVSNGPITKTKVYPDCASQDTEGTPPTSKLVSKLFPKLKPEKPKAQVTHQQEQQLTEARQAALGDGIQSRALRDKLAELEQEIERFRKENASLEALRKEREQGLDHIRKEMAEFEKQKSEELQRLNDFKNEETRKLKKEKRVFEQYQKAAKAMPDRREREEMDSVKSQLAELQDELKRKEQRWTSSTKRLRDRIEHLELENDELKDEVKMLEKKRLEAWQLKEAAVTMAKKDERHLPVIPTDPLPHAVTPLAHKASTGNVLPPQPQTHTGTPQPKDTNLAQRDNILRLSCNTDDSELLDSSQTAVGSADNMSIPSAPHTMSKAKLTSSPISPQAREPLAGATSMSQTHRSSVLRKTAVAANITSAVDKGDDQYEEMQHTDGKIERIYTNGAREILFSNGTRKQVSADGQSIIVSFFNGDIKQILPDQRVVYYYADAQTTHTTYPDGLEIILFPNGQTEKNYPDGTKEITFPDQIIKYLFPTGIEESIFPDGTVIRVEKNGDKVMEFPNGQREVHTPQYKRREYPDGTVKTVYPDGRQETRYSSGRIRVKDKDGNIIVDRRV